MAVESRVYIIEDYADFEGLQKKFPKLKFSGISPRILVVEVPAGEEKSFDELEKLVNIIGIPSLYGLNLDGGFEDSNINFFHNYPFGELRGKDVIVGFVDTGIDYTNPLFQYEDGTTRIQKIWDQTVVGIPPTGFNYGNVYSEQDINRALKSEKPLDVVPSIDEVGHGTFLAGVAAGYDRSGENAYTGGAPDATLLIVKLKPASNHLRDYYLIENGVYACQDNDVLAGLRFLLDVANRLEKPLAVCIGVGCNWGAHNGNTVVERSLQDISTLANLVVTVAAGNEANQAHHFEGVIKEGEIDNIEVNVGENEKGMIIQIWASQIDKLAVGMSSPLGYQTQKVPVSNNKPVEFRPPLEESKITITYKWPDASTGAEKIEIRMETPTPGIWSIKVHGEIIVNGDYNVWLPREGFIKPNTRIVKPEAYTTVCIPGTMSDGLVVGAYDSKDKSLYVASGRGPTTNSVIKPDLIAPGVDVRGPSKNSGFTTYTGTSVAAAITTSACALLLEWAIVKGNMPKMNTRVAKTILIRGAVRKKDTVYPNNIEGYGRLDLKNSLSLL